MKRKRRHGKEEQDEDVMAIRKLIRLMDGFVYQNKHQHRRGEYWRWLVLCRAATRRAIILEDQEKKKEDDEDEDDNLNTIVFLSAEKVARSAQRWHEARRRAQNVVRRTLWFLKNNHFVGFAVVLITLASSVAWHSGKLFEKRVDEMRAVVVAWMGWARGSRNETLAIEASARVMQIRGLISTQAFSMPRIDHHVDGNNNNIDNRSNSNETTEEEDVGVRIG